MMQESLPWLSLQRRISGHVLLPLLLLLFVFSKGAKRHPTLINVLISYIVSSIVACLLLYTGTTTGPEPSKQLCVIQTGLLNGVPPMWSMSAFMLMLYIWSRFALPGKEHIRESAVIRVLMLAAPYVAFVGWALPALYVASHHQRDVDRHRRYFYCSVNYDPFANAVALFSSVICLLTTLVEVHLGFLLYRNWRALRAAGQSGGVDLAFVIRTCVFGMYIAAGMIISLITIWNPTTSITDLYGASIGTSAVLIFGSQSDVWQVLMFWRSKPQTSSMSEKNVLPPPPPPLVMVNNNQTNVNFVNPWDPEAQGVRDSAYDGKVNSDAKRLEAHRVTVIGRPSEAFPQGLDRV